MSSNLTQNIEKIKKEKDGLDVISDIYIYAVLGEKVTKDDLIRFKWYGIYEQEDAKNYFKLKIPLSLGQLNIEQIKTLSFISKEYAKNSLDFSKEQKVELKWIKIHNLPHIFNLLNQVDLNTIFEAGHNVRNVLTCPLNSIKNPQIADVSEIASKINKTFIGNKLFSNLPNKLQFGISGWEQGCVSTQEADINFDAHINDKDKLQFSVKILKNHIGFITPTQVIPMAKVIAKVFKDYGQRDENKDNSFQSLVQSWGQKEFKDFVNSILTFKIKDLNLINQELNNKSDHFGIHESKDEGKSYIGCKVETKEFNRKGFDNLAILLEKFDATKIKVTNVGNIIILDAPTSRANNLAKELKKISLNPFI